MSKRILIAFTSMAFGISTLLLGYTIYFGYELWRRPSVVSYFPWTWQQTYTDGSAIQMFLISTAISFVVFLVSLLALLNLSRPAVTVVKAQEKVSGEVRGLPDLDTPYVDNSWTSDEGPSEPDSIDEILAEMNRSKQRKSILEGAVAREKEHFSNLLESLNERMTSQGYPIVVPEGDGRVASAKVALPSESQQQQPVKKLSWGERRAAKKLEKEQRRQDEKKKRRQEKNRLVSLEEDSNDPEEELEEEVTTAIMTTDQSAPKELVGPATARKQKRKNQDEQYDVDPEQAAEIKAR